MRREVLALTVAASLLTRLAEPAPISIVIRGERVDIHADGVPLVQVLNGVAWEAKMSIVYDSTPPPQDPVSINIKNATLSDAVTELLHGHGLVYVAKMDATGTRVDTLVLTTGAAGQVNLAPGEPLPNGDPPMDVPQPEYTPEPPQPEAYIPPPTPGVPAAAAAASAWTPQPVVLPSSIGAAGSAPPPTPTPQMGMPPYGRMPPGYQGHGYPQYTPAPTDASQVPGQS